MKSQHIFVLSWMFAAGVLGCTKPNETTWANRSKSPDGMWLVLAHTEHTNAGFGADAQSTIVELKQSFHDAKPVLILEFDDGPESPADMQAKWVSPSHLDITYRNNPRILFRAIKAFGMDVSVERLDN